MKQPGSIKLGEISNVKGGKRLPKGSELQDKETGHPYIRVRDMSENGLLTSDIKYISLAIHEKIKRYTISATDVYISIAGTIGRIGMVPSKLDGANLTENAAKICEISSEFNPRYLMYYLNSSYGKAQIASKTGGTSQPKLALSRIEKIDIPALSKAVQDQIVVYASKYDNLIENNRRRIQLLEQSAWLLYKEWFVHLRFPGHEHVKITDGVPEGWGRKNIGNVAPLQYGKALKKDNCVPGPYPVYGSSGVVGTHEKASVTGPAIIVGRKGNVGSVFWSASDFHPIDTVYYIKSEHCTTHLYYALLNTQFINTDVAVPGLNRDFAHSREVLVPDATIIALFEEHTTVIRDQINRLTKYNDALARTRDLLLPRLMNGEVAA